MVAYAGATSLQEEKKIASLDQESEYTREPFLRQELIQAREKVDVP
jgi:hypothetical protein